MISTENCSYFSTTACYFLTSITGYMSTHTMANNSYFTIFKFIVGHKHKFKEIGCSISSCYTINYRYGSIITRRIVTPINYNYIIKINFNQSSGNWIHPSWEKETGIFITWNHRQESVKSYMVLLGQNDLKFQILVKKFLLMDQKYLLKTRYRWTLVDRCLALCVNKI